MPSSYLEPSKGSKPPATRTPERRGGEGCPLAGDTPDPLQGLSAVASGCVLTLALAGGPGGDRRGEVAALGALADPDAAVCRAALVAMEAMDRAERARAIAGLLRRARAPVPDGIEDVHPGWLRAALEDEATPLLRAIVGGLPPEVGAVAREIIAARGDGDGAELPPGIADGALADLRRAVFGALVAMPRPADAEHADTPPWLRLAVLPFPALLADIERRGAMTLGTSLAGAPLAVLARAAAAAGSALGTVVLEVARRAPPVEERERARALVAAAARVAEPSVGSTTIVGLLALASELTTGPAQVIAQRLPPRLGRILINPSS